MSGAFLKNPWRFLRPTAAALLMAVAMAGWAQTPSPMPEWYYSQGHLLEAHVRGDELPKWQYLLGLAVNVEPKYPGANAYTTQGGPSVDIRYRDIAFFSTGEGIGYNVLHGDGYRAGVALAYDLGRDTDDDHHLYGLGDLSPAPEAKFFAEYLIFPVTLRVDGRHTFGGQGGWIGDVGVYTPLAGNKKFFVFTGLSATFADETNQRHNFGVDDVQSLRSGYPIYRASSGLRSYSFGLDGGYFLTNHWMVTGMLAAEHLEGPAGHSPFVQEQGQFTTVVNAAYRW